MNLDLTGKTALVCGSSQGIGLAAAVELAALGCRVVLMARNPQKLQEALLTLPKPNNQSHLFAVADFTNPQEVAMAAEKLLNGFEIHILVNNTGGPAAGSALDADIASFRTAFEQHLISNHVLVQAVVPGMKKACFGRIINVISTSVKQPLPNLGVSNTIRGAVANWSKTLANELAPHGITVNNVLPGATATSRLDEIVKNKAQKTGKTPEQHLDEMAAQVPAGRVGLPSEIGAAIAFLASPSASYINGVNLPVDGGRTSSL